MKDLTKILVDTDNVIKPERPIIEVIQYADNAKRQYGRFSWGKVLSGIMLSLAGAIVVAGSAMATVMTFGISSPLSAIGFKIGTSMLAKGLSISVDAVGLSMMSVGSTVAYKGRQRLFSKRIYQLSKSVTMWHKSDDSIARKGKGLLSEFSEEADMQFKRPLLSAHDE